MQHVHLPELANGGGHRGAFLVLLLWVLLVTIGTVFGTGGIPLGQGHNEAQLTPAGSYCGCGYNNCGCLGIEYPDLPDPTDIATAQPLATPVVTVPVGNLPLLTPIPLPTTKSTPLANVIPTAVTVPLPTATFLFQPTPTVTVSP